MKYHGKNGKKESLHLCDLIMAFFLTSMKLTEVFFKNQFYHLLFCCVNGILQRMMV